MTVEELANSLKGLHPQMPVNIMSGDRIVSDVIFLVGMDGEKPLYFFASHAECEKRIQGQTSIESATAGYEGEAESPAVESPQSDSNVSEVHDEYSATH
jgi:hypothetical protein